MAVHKGIRSKSTPQPKPQRTRDHQLKAEILDVLRHLNRGYGVALAAFDKLEHKDQLPRMFPADVLNQYRNRTESLRAEANRDLLRLVAGREDREALRFTQLRSAAP
jgi:hypothetical protein